MNLRLACLTRAFLDALVAEGVERMYAIELVADTTWSVYRMWGRLASVAGRPKRGRSGLRFSAQKDDGTVSLRFPFNAPGYLVQSVRAEHAIAFDVVRCPVASYFRQHNAADLCLAAWCNLDYPLSEMTQQRLVRTKTLAEGADRCDFRIMDGGTPRRPS
jgi:ubiquinone biosynthesis protein